MEKEIIQNTNNTSPDVNKKKKKDNKSKKNIWWIKAAIISLFLAAFFSYLSNLTSNSDSIALVIIMLFILIVLSIIADMIGVSITSCDITPFISMSSRKIWGAKTAVWIKKNDTTFASILNDIIGDCFGVISGACAAAICIKLVVLVSNEYQILISIAISAVVSSFTIGGKALMKTVAVKNSKDIVFAFAKILSIFNKDEKKEKKKSGK